MAIVAVLGVIGLLLALYLRNPDNSLQNSDPNKNSQLFNQISQSETIRGQENSSNHNNF